MSQTFIGTPKNGQKVKVFVLQEILFPKHRIYRREFVGFYVEEEVMSKKDAESLFRQKIDIDCCDQIWSHTEGLVIGFWEPFLKKGWYSIGEDEIVPIQGNVVSWE